MRHYAAKALRISAMLAVLVLCGFAATAAMPSQAQAIPFLDQIFDINNWLMNDILKPPIEGMLAGAWGFINLISVSSIITAPFDTMLSGSGGTSVWDVAEGVNDGIVKPIALSILALAMLVQLIHVAGKADQDAAMPILRDLIMIALFYVCFRWLINNSADLCVSVYTDLNEIAKNVGTVANVSENPFSLGEVSSFGEIVMLFLCAVIVWFACLLAAVVSLLMAYMRAIQLYIFAAFAPIPLALLGFEQTRQYGIGFIKNFVALVLAGAVMVFMLFCFPLLVNGAISVGTLGTGVPFTPGLGAVTMLAMCLLLLIGLLKSGSIARSVLGE